MKVKEENQNQNQKRNIICFNCSKKGHFAKFCRAIKTESNWKCYSCSKQGHIANQYIIKNTGKRGPAAFTAIIDSINKNDHVKERKLLQYINSGASCHMLTA